MPRKNANNKREETPDPWRIHNYFFYIKTKPAEHCTYHECTPATCNTYAWSIYVIYHGKKGNQIYFGSTSDSVSIRLQNHFKDVYGTRTRPTLFHHWMRTQCPTIEEARADIKIAVVQWIFFPRSYTDEQKKTAIVQYEKKYINDWFSTGRTLNDNLISAENRATLRNQIREGRKLRFSILHRVSEIINVIHEEGASEGVKALQDLCRNLLGCESEDDIDDD